MAIIYDAVLEPSKQDLLKTWLPEQPWFQELGTDAAELEHLGAFRFDDPAGEVGMETHLLSAAGRVVHVPLTYRGAPLPGAEEFLAGTMEHSVLGDRWIYDACADPVYATALATVMVQGGAGAEQFLDVDGKLEPLTGAIPVRGSGGTGGSVPEITTAVPTTSGIVTTIDASPLTLTVYRAPDPSEQPGTKLTCTLPGQHPLILASAR
ncbi:CG0192-related protein [Arthrobacter sulfonylureivorans]|uniref:CG0192-related protein n=1 Tax=Arthrobacter sulfonylureivorans TaxID=2486855 RepID=UPI0039E3D1AC